MVDQAQALRNLVRNYKQVQTPVDHSTRILTVTSGKGGVGKSNFTLNFALALQSLGKKVLVFDADLGMANIDVLMGVNARVNLYHLLKREKNIHDIILTGPKDLHFIAGGSGFQELLTLSEEELIYFTEQVNMISEQYDFIIFDTGAGLSKETLNFILSAEETIVVTTPEPTSITDAYALIKIVHRMNAKVDFRLVVNRVSDEQEGNQTAKKINLVAEQFLDLSIPTLGYVMDDPSVSSAVKKQVPFSIAFPNCISTRNIEQLAKAYLNNSSQPPGLIAEGGVKGFLTRMMKFMK
ncbi:cobyrinic acid a,c-diamide synthase [Paenibacillus selenitireducens]|uniref:Cobyrinic acid a,c-diamide synthase n=1 Tax=Paenibacillus selenitireducens TaxID=1324314 RepID=A0A1T2XCW3_9BACL|nr:MinD/ParA family protein [Paenibacillus selenitireducens]OPA77612.1 cobyrinic acid a,c-diamide synthase [Paenibacillus selenitireducens]